MSLDLYFRKNLADTLLKKFSEGRERIYLIKADGVPVWNDDTAEMEPPPIVRTLLQGVTLRMQDGQIAGSVVEAGDRFVIVRYCGQEINTGDKIEIDGCLWSIVATQPTNYAGLDICHKLQCRR